MKRLSSVLLIVIMLLVSCACGTEDVATAVRHYAPDTESSSPTDTQVLEPVETTQQPIDGFRVSSNTEYTFANIIYSIPSYFGKEPKHSSDIGRWFFAEDNGEALAMFLLAVSGPPNNVDLSDFNSFKGTIANDIMNGEAFSNVELLKKEDTTMADLSAERIFFNCTYDGYDLTMCYTYAYDPTDNLVKYVGFGENDKCIYDYFEDIEKIVNTAEHETVPTPTPTPTPTPAPEVKAAPATYAEEYVLNKNTGVFHHPGCRAISAMKEYNKEEVVKTRDEVVAMGYKSCGICHP